MMRIFTFLGVAILLAPLPTGGQQKTPKGPGWAMDYGPFLCSSVGTAESDKDETLLANKGITLKLGKNASACFDTDLLRFSAGWTGGWLDRSKTHHTSMKGTLPTRYKGKIRFRTPKGPGWASGGSFDDPRKEGRGPLPREWAHYKGLYLHGDRVILAYTVGGVGVLETPSYVESGGAGAFVRMLNIEPAKNPLALRVSGGAGDSPVTFLGDSGDVVNEKGVLSIPARDGVRRLTVAVWVDGEPDASILSAPPDLKKYCDGGKRRWDRDLVTRGTVGRVPGPYVVDTVAVPFENPWNAWLRFTGGDFFSDGSAAMCTWSGDVWTASNLDSTLAKVTWRRFAAGLYEPLGLKIVDDVVYVLGRDQITRLQDLNDDGEADFYENFNNDCITMANYHAFAFELNTDSKGDFYYSRCGHRVAAGVPYHGCVIRVPKDGGRHEIVAKGFRAPNGMSIGPNDEITVSDNQGNWMPSSKISLIRPGGFYGYMTHPWRDKPKPDSYEPPICWLPHKIDNSSGSQIWVTSDKWGPFKGRMLHTSYGTGMLFYMPYEIVDGVPQGGAVEFPLTFSSGIMRGRFNPVDGQLYVFGIGGGWQSRNPKFACLQRVRYTGAPANALLEYHVTPSGVRLTFTDPLDPETAGSTDYYAGSWWNYKWAEKYGSEDYLVSRPKRRGREEMEIKSAKLLPDGKTVDLEIDGIRPVMQFLLRMRLRAEDRSRIALDFYGTINRVPKR